MGPVLELLKLSGSGVVVDATLGGGGHAEAILEATPGCRLVGLDADEAALEYARRRLEKFGERFCAVHSNFRRMGEALAGLGIRRVDAILMDLGVSSRQLEDAVRGFSFSLAGPLDMRMDRSAGTTAAEWLAQASEAEIEKTLQTYGEERHARKIAAAIIKERKLHEIRTTQHLSELVARTLGFKKGKIHPATRTFQAVRIVVNGELDALEEGLPQAVELLQVGGRMAVITFHSLEDRIVKNVFRIEERERKRIEWINKHVIKPERAETLDNPRARSAKLRVVEKVKD